MQQPQPSPLPTQHHQVSAPQAQPNPLHPVRQPQPTPQEALDPNNEIVQGLQHKEETIQDLISMGFNRPEVEQALVCAYYNKERAIDYLLNVG